MPITYDRKAFFDAARESVFRGALTPGQVSGTAAILDLWERLQPTGDTRCLAYVLATPWWETARTMQPIEEIGRGRGRAYGAPAGPYGQVYYGRGFVQLTWLTNYQHATARLHALGVLHADEDLARTPALALRLDVAATILVFGMAEGWFTGHKLADFFHGTATDYAGARRIINGTDQAETIAAAAEHLFAALKGALVFQGAPTAPATPPAAPTPAGGLLSRLATYFGRH